MVVLPETIMTGQFFAGIPVRSVSVSRSWWKVETVARCSDGHGGASFMETMTQPLTPAEILAQIEATPKADTVPDQWESQILARILSRFHVVLITEADPDLVRAMKMHPASDLQQALQMAEELLGRKGSITVIPEGISAIVV